MNQVKKGDPSGLRRLDLAVAELLDVDVLEGQDLDVLGQPASGPVHVPDPGVGEGHLEEHVPGLGARLHVHLVAQVEAPIGLHDVLEDADDVAVLPVEVELHLGLVLLEILGAHRRTSYRSAWSGVMAAASSGSQSSSWGSRLRGGVSVIPAARRTFTNLIRCTGLGPCSSSASVCSAVQ